MEDGASTNRNRFRKIHVDLNDTGLSYDRIGILANLHYAKLLKNGILLIRVPKEKFRESLEFIKKG